MGAYEPDSETAVVAAKLTRLLSEAEPPIKKSHYDQEVGELMAIFSNLMFRVIHLWFHSAFSEHHLSDNGFSGTKDWRPGSCWGHQGILTC